MAAGGLRLCHVTGSCDWRRAPTSSSLTPSQTISWPHHPNPTSLQSFLTATLKSRFFPDQGICLGGGSGTVLSVWCLWRLTFISWCQAGTTEALWPWMSGHARHEPAVPFRQPTPTRAHDTPQCLCVVWATSPRTHPARRLLSGWVQGSRKGKIWRRWGDDCVGMMGLCRLAGAQLR